MAEKITVDQFKELTNTMDKPIILEFGADW